MLNCTRVVWQLRDWETRPDPLSQVRNVGIAALRDVMSERRMQQRSLATTLIELHRICDARARYHQSASQTLCSTYLASLFRLRQPEQLPDNHSA